MSDKKHSDNPWLYMIYLYCGILSLIALGFIAVIVWSFYARKNAPPVQQVEVISHGYSGLKEIEIDGAKYIYGYNIGITAKQERKD